MLQHVWQMFRACICDAPAPSPPPHPGPGTMLYIRGMRASHLFNLSVTTISNIKYVLLLFPAPAPLPGVSHAGQV